MSLKYRIFTQILLLASNISLLAPVQTSNRDVNWANLGNLVVNDLNPVN